MVGRPRPPGTPIQDAGHATPLDYGAGHVRAGSAFDPERAPAVRLTAGAPPYARNVEE